MKRLSPFIIILLLISFGFSMAEPLVLVHGFNEHSNALDKIEDVVNDLGFHFDGKPVKPGYESNTTIEKITRDRVAPQISSGVGRRQGVFIAHSMGGLVSRRYLLDHRTDGRARLLITIGTPHRGTGLASLSNWNRFLLADVALIITPPYVDSQPEKPLVVAIVEGGLVAISGNFVKFACKFYRFRRSIPREWYSTLPTLAAFFDSGEITTIVPPCVKEMAPGSGFLSKLNSTPHPSTGIEKKGIYYASIYGINNNFFSLMNDMGIGWLGSTVGAIAGAYAAWGGYYVITGGWWNWLRTLDGLLYLGGAAGLANETVIYNGLLVGSLQSDGVVPVKSQEFPEGVVQDEDHWIEPQEAKHANHFRELWPTPDYPKVRQELRQDLYYILTHAQK